MAEGDSTPRGPTPASHIFAEFESLEGLNAPIRTSVRIKYTAIGVCRRYIALGASTGGLYIFHRESLKYLQVLSNKEGAITKIAFAPNDNLVGFATSLGFVIAWELNLDRRDPPERLVASTAHRNVCVTCLQWDGASLRLFSGDNKGRVTQTNADSRKASGFFKMPTELVVETESPIVQLDFADEKVLVSAQAKCIVCDTDKKQSYTVGKKPRDGQFGGCFLQRPGTEFPSIYTGRPGSRVWEANIVGQVQATHQFKHLLAVPPLPVVGPGKHPVFVDEQKPQSFNFPVLLPMGSRFLLTWTDKGVFVFNPLAVDVIMWTADITDIIDAGAFKGQLYCLQENGQLHRYFFLSIERCIAKLFGQSLWEQCAQMCTRFSSKVTHIKARRHIPMSLLKELNFQLLDHTKDLNLVEQMEELVDRVQTASPGSWSTTSSRRSSLESCDSVRLESGIYLIRNRRDSEESFDDTPMQNNDVTLIVPSMSDVHEQSIQSDVHTDDGFSSDTAIPELPSHHGDIVQDVTMHDGTQIGDQSLNQVDDSKLTLDSQNIVENVSLAPPNTIQCTYQTEILPNRPDITSQIVPNYISTTANFDTTEISTQSENEAGWQNVNLDAQETYSDDVFNQMSQAEERKIATHQEEDSLLKKTQGEDTSLNRPSHLEQLGDQNIGVCSGPRITPSPDIAPELTLANMNTITSYQDPEGEESLPSTLLDLNTDSDSVSISDLSVATSPGKESVPYSKSNIDTIHPSVSPLPQATSHPFENSLPTVPQNTDELQPIRRTMSVPCNVDDAEMTAVVIKRRPSESGKDKGKKKKKEKKRKSRIAQIGELQTKPATKQPEEIPTDTMIPDNSYKPTPSPANNSPLGNSPPKRSMSTPSISTPLSPSKQFPIPHTSMIKKSDATSTKLTETAPSPVPNPPQPQRPLPTSKDSAPWLKTSRTNSWDSNSSTSWQSQAAGMVPLSTTGMAFVDLSSTPQVLNLPSVSDSISAMKESLSSTLTNAKSFLLNKMESIDSRDELHQSASSPAMFNNFFPEEDHNRVERLQELVQVGKEQQVHPAARGLVAATSVARSKLEDPSILYSPKETRRVLEEWVNHLHAAVHELYSEKHQKFPTKDADTMCDVPDSSIIQSSDKPSKDVELTKSQFDQKEGEQLIDRTAHVESEEPSATESTSSEIMKDVDDKGDAVSKSVEGGVLGEKEDAKQTVLLNTSQKNSNLGFLEKLGRGPHSMEVFHDRRKTEEQDKSKVGSKDIESEDDLKMDPIPSVVEVQDNSVEETVIANGHLPQAKMSDQSEVNKPNRSPSDIEIEGYTVIDHEVIKKQVYCIKDPLSLPTEIHQEIGELVVMCFEMGVYGNLKKYFIKVVKVSQDNDLISIKDDNGNTELRTKSDVEVQKLDSSSECHLDKAAEFGSPFHIAKHLLSSNESEHPESDIQIEQIPATVEMESMVALETDLDKVAAGFIKEYFHFLDVNKVRQVLSVREGQRKYSFDALIHCLLEKYKDNTQLRKIDEAAHDVGIDHLKTVAQKSPGLELCFAVRIYEKSAEGGTKYMLMTHPKLKAWEVLHIMSQQNENPAADFLAYVMGIMDITAATKRDDMLKDVCRETSVQMGLFQFALSHNAPAKGGLFCSCGEMARPSSHLKDWPHKDLISKLMAQDTSHEVKQQMLKLCQQAGYWYGVLMMLQELNERSKALMIAIQLADAELLSGTKESVIKVKSVDEWKLVLNNMTRLLPDQSRKYIEQLNCIKCNNIVWPTSMKSNKSSDWSDQVCITPEEPECDWTASDNNNPDWLSSAMSSFKDEPDWLPTITWENIAQLLVRSVGAQAGVKLLAEVKIPEKALSRQFHQACIMSAILEKGQRTLTHTMLERVDTYLWSKRPTTLAPSLYQLVRNETIQGVNRKPGEPVTLEEQMALRSQFCIPQGEHHFLEEPDCHWGVHIDVESNCGVCGSPYYTTLPMAAQGLLIFTCGHVFHKLCIPEKVCVLCSP